MFLKQLLTEREAFKKNIFYLLLCFLFKKNPKPNSYFFSPCLTKWWYGCLSKLGIICWLHHCLRTTGIHSGIRKTIGCLDLFPFTWSFVLLFPFPCISFLSRPFWINAHLGPDCAIKSLASIIAWMRSKVGRNRQSHRSSLDCYQY